MLGWRRLRLCGCRVSHVVAEERKFAESGRRLWSRLCLRLVAEHARQQRAELQFAEDVADGGFVDRVAAVSLLVEFNRHFGAYRGEFF